MKDWDRLEERFEALVALGADIRTPIHERTNACIKAVEMISKGQVRAIAKGRWDAVARWVQWAKRVLEEADHEVEHFVGRFSTNFCKYPFNLNGKNGWQCCRCGRFKALEMTVTGSYIWENTCQCGHIMCGRYEEKRNWT